LPITLLLREEQKTAKILLFRVCWSVQTGGKETMVEQSKEKTYLGGMKMTDTEIAALGQLCQDLGPLFAGIVQRLGRGEGLRVCHALEFGEMQVTWLIKPGCAVCVITKDGKTVHSFKFICDTPMRFHFTELPLGPAN
jgi:hypothetical protein